MTPTRFQPPSLRGIPRAFAIWLLAGALVLAGTLGLLHQTLHAHLAPPSAERGQGPTAAARDVAVAAHGLAKLFPHHGQDDCRLYDQLAHGAALPSVPALLLPVLPPVPLLAWFQGEALARWVALFDARGPPSSR